jgi:hypothetical protein
MRATQLARAAAEAEGLRLRLLARRQVARLVYGAIALIFLIAALAVGHVLAWLELRGYFNNLYSLLIVLAADCVLLLIFALLAAISSPGAMEREALEIRQNAVAQLGASVTTLMVLRPLLSRLPGRHLYSLVLAGLTARNLSRR